MKFYKRPTPSTVNNIKYTYVSNAWSAPALSEQPDAFMEEFYNPVPTLGDLFADNDWTSPPLGFVNYDLIVCHNVSGTPTLTSYKAATAKPGGSSAESKPTFIKLTASTSVTDPFINLSPDGCNDVSSHLICSYCHAKIIDIRRNLTKTRNHSCTHFLNGIYHIIQFNVNTRKFI